MAIAKLLQEYERISFLLCQLLRAQRCSGGDAAATLVPNTRHQQLNIPAAEREQEQCLQSKRSVKGLGR